VGARYAFRGLAVHARARIGRGTSAQGFYAQRLRYGDLAFDVGANVGEHTAAMLKRGARVVALEPQAELARDLAHRFPRATVLALGASDRSGKGTLFTSTEHRHLATLNSTWRAIEDGNWDGQLTVDLATLDELIAAYGEPAFVKIDTEGLEDKVLAGLSRPISQILFEVHSDLPDVAARSFERLARLGTYEFRAMERESWIFGPTITASDLLADLPDWGDVYGRLTRPGPPRVLGRRP